MGNRPSSEHSLDRIDNNNGYFPENCRWATIRQQNNNKRDNITISFYGEKLTISQWSSILEIPKHRIYNRIQKGLNKTAALIKQNKRVKYRDISQLLDLI